MRNAILVVAVVALTCTEVRSQAHSAYLQVPPEIESTAIDMQGRTLQIMCGADGVQSTAYWPETFSVPIDEGTLSFTLKTSANSSFTYSSPIPEVLYDELIESENELNSYGYMRFDGREFSKYQITRSGRQSSSDLGLDIRLGPSVAVDPARSLLITNVNVVDDARAEGIGAWSFGGVMTRLAASNGISNPAEMVQQWFELWDAEQTVAGGDTATARDSSVILGKWPKIGGDIDLTRSPFRLLAIVNRIDLRSSIMGGQSGDAGEGRFVFCLLDEKGNAQTGTNQFLVIFEYKINRGNLSGVRKWAQGWADLSNIDFTNPAFNDQLENITNEFVELGQIRTNEIGLGAEWELREFHVVKGSGISQVTSKRTPANRFRSVGTGDIKILEKFIRDNETELANPNIAVEIPEEIGGVPFAAAASAMTLPSEHWRVTDNSIDNEAVHQLSLNSCNGCHGGETHTGQFGPQETPFVHISIRQKGQASVLSKFLSGATITDPRDGNKQRAFNDLERRRQDMLLLLSANPLSELLHQPLNMVH